MKKFRILWVALCLVLAFQQAALPICGQETGDGETTETTEAQETVYTGEIPTVEYGNASVTNGCRTVNGQTPLMGTERILDTAQSAFIYETSTQTVIYAYNPDTHVYPGSLAKMMTALLAIENCDMDQVVTCSTRWNSSLPRQAVVADLKEGEQMTMYDLVACLLVGSANDAALNIAHTVASSEEEFVQMMNDRAKQIGCTDTNFTNVHGLDDPEQYTSARDMVKITVEACQNETFQELFGTTEYTIEPTNRTDEDHDIQTSNHLMYELIISKFYDERVTGGMPSYTSTSGASIACSASSGDMNLVVVVMGATRTFNASGNANYYGNFDEATELLESGFGDFKICRVLYPDMALDQFSVSGGECDVVGQPDVAVNTVLPNSCQLDDLIFRYTLEGGGLTAPIAQGDKIATVQVWYGISCVTESEVFAMNTVRSTINSGVSIQSTASRDDSSLTGVLKFLGIACLVIAVPVGAYLVINFARRAAAQRRRRRRRAGRRRSR